MSDINTNHGLTGSVNGHTAASPEVEETTARFDRDELTRGWQEYKAKMPRLIPLIKYAAKTDMGQVRENNEDKFDFYEPEVPSVLASRGSLFAVADGIGGALAGQIASEMMLKNLITSYYDNPSPNLHNALRVAIAETNDRIHSLSQMIPERSGMGTTLTAAVFIEDRVVIAQVGDSRAYLLRDGGVRQVTTDHSWVEEQVKAGVMSRSDAESSPFRNVITRSVGASPTVQPDLYEEEARIGDIWVLCSDGLTGHVADDEIARIAGQNSPSEAARQLVELANANGGRDNITVFVLSLRDLISVPTPAAENEASELPVSVEPSSASTLAIARETLPASPGEFEAETFRQATAIPSGEQALLSAENSPRPGWRKLFGRQA